MGFAGIFLVTALSLYLYTKTDHARNLLISNINTAIPGTLAAENIDVSFIDSYVRLDGVQLRDRQDKTCFQFKSLLLDFKISAIFKKVVEITLFSVEHPQINLVVDKDGRINLLDALMSEDKKSPEKEDAQKEGKGLPVNVVVKKAQIVEGAVRVNDPDNSV